ncbi:hypothetical protein K439DRAFT_22839 [Ramaria rubella]|nr:hypothetical protein K439DRAFT_22839 [Ramaria rubella]
MDAIVNRESTSMFHGTFLISIIGPNRVLQKQKEYQTSTRPLYLRGPRARLYLGVYMVGWSAGLLGAVVGMYSLIKNIQR